MKFPTLWRFLPFAQRGVDGESKRLVRHAGYRPPIRQAETVLPMRYWGRRQLRDYYETNFVAAKFVDLVVDDMFIRWRKFEDLEDEMTEAEQKHRVRDHVARSMKLGKLYGTGLLAIISQEAPLETELEVSMVRKGDLVHLLAVDRYDAEVRTVDDALMSATYGQPLLYRMHQTSSSGGMPATFDIHASRVIRFDGLPPTFADIDPEGAWGVSVLTQARAAIEQDTDLARAASYLVDRASLDVVKTARFADSLATESEGVKDTASLAEIGEAVHSQKSTYRTLFMDNSDSFERHSYTFTGISDLFDRFARRIASAAGVPMTRFWGASPMGMNATGDSDARNYAIQIATEQERTLREPLRRLDGVLARDSGLREAPKYRWNPLIDMTQNDLALVAQGRVKAVSDAYEKGIIELAEARKGLTTNEVFDKIDPAKKVANPPKLQAEIEKARQAKSQGPASGSAKKSGGSK